MESLTLEDIDTYTEISHRIIHEDVFSIVDSTFMPCGVECDQYSVMGEILELSEVRNTYTDEKVYQMTLECNNMVFRMAINEADLLGGTGSRTAFLKGTGMASGQSAILNKNVNKNI